MTGALCVLLPAVEATIRFTYVEKYPDEPPLWEIHAQENLEDRDAEDILALLQQQVGPQDIRFLPAVGLISRICLSLSNVRRGALPGSEGNGAAHQDVALIWAEHVCLG